VIGASADSAEVVAREVAIMQALSRRPSPHIVRIFGYEKDTWQHYLVLQLCEGGELFDRIADHVFTETEAAAAIAYVLTGLAACHDAGICHRDMKPENVLYANRTAGSPLLITDFGLSCRFKMGKKTIRDWCGTTPYMGACARTPSATARRVYRRRTPGCRRAAAALPPRQIVGRSAAAKAAKAAKAGTVR
jgi:serine/threonine protein kinase